MYRGGVHFENSPFGEVWKQYSTKLTKLQRCFAPRKDTYAYRYTCVYTRGLQRMCVSIF